MDMIYDTVSIDLKIPGNIIRKLESLVPLERILEQPGVKDKKNTFHCIFFFFK